MSDLAENCRKTVLGPAAKAVRKTSPKPRSRKLLRLLKPRKNLLLTTHQHPDPDALASCMGLRALLAVHLPDTKVTIAIKGKIGRGQNDAFARFAGSPLAWDEIDLATFDAVVLLDAQPQFGSSPLPPDVKPVAVIDHHRSRRPDVAYADIRTDVGATASIIFSYFMELQTPIPRDLAAILLYAIESDLAGAAGTPGELDNLALSTLTLLADTRMLYQMRYTDLGLGFYRNFHVGLTNAVCYGSAVITHLGPIESPERPALMADLLLRLEQAKWAMVTAIHEDRLVVSLRTRTPEPLTAGDLAARLLKGIGEGGGHRTKAGGFVRIDPADPGQITRIRDLLRRRCLRSLHTSIPKAQKLIDG